VGEDTELADWESIPCMSVLVTGGAGYVGSHIVLELLDAGDTVVVIDDESTGHRSIVPDVATFIKGDIGDQELTRRVIREYEVDSIIHCAGSVVVPESIEDPLKYYRNNTINSLQLIECAIKADVRNFLFSSTAAVYGIPANVPVDEEAPLAPISPYGSSKMMTESILRHAASAHPLQYIALRYFNVAGADPLGRSGQSTPRATHLIKVACEAATGRRPYVEVYGNDYPTPDGTCIRDYVHVTDLARAHALAVAYLRSGGHSCVLNCGYGRGYSVLDVIYEVKKHAATDFEVRHVERRPGDPPLLVAKADRLLDQLKWTPEFNSLEKIICHALRWERQLPQQFVSSM
jgi:UDP-glucose 4-epimerase